MIAERDIIQAIRECENDPMTAAKVGKLADLYIVYDHLFGEPYYDQHSYRNETEKVIDVKSGTEFLEAVNGRPAAMVWAIMDDLMETLKVTNERVYKSVLRKVKEL